MPRLKTKAIDAAELQTAPLPMADESKIALVDDAEAVQAVPSPALTLQNDLLRSEVKKIPVGWTVLGLAIICGAFWAGVWSLLA